MPTLNEDWRFNGQLAVGGTAVNKTNDPIWQARDSHQNHLAHYSQAGVAIAETRWIHTVRGSGVVKAVKAGCLVACVGNAVATLDVRKNGTTILTAPISLSESQSAREEVAGVLSGVVAISAGDVLEVVVAVNAGTGTLGTGLFAWLDLDEQYAAS